MKMFGIISFLILMTYTSALPSPDTNIQIQHYDGPVYVSSPPNCCPFCNSILKPQAKDGKDTFEPAPEIVYPQPVYGNTHENEPFEITISVDPKDETVSGNDKTNLAFGKFNLGIPKESGSFLHTDPLKTIHNIPVTCNTPGYGTGNLFGTDMFGKSKPLSNYLPINTATQNTCQVPILTCNGNSDEPVLVPQKFMYSLILDGEVGSNQNGCDSRFYYY